MGQIKERLRMVKTTIGSIVVLSKLPILGTIRITFYDGFIIRNPECDEFGNIKISPKIAMRLNFLYDNPEDGIKPETYLRVDVIYREKILNLSADILENKEYISQKVKTLDGLNGYIRELKLFHKANPEYMFKEVILFGRYCIDLFAQIGVCEKPIVKDDVAFKNEISTQWHRTFYLANPIPKQEDVCPICEKRFNITDVRHGKTELSEKGNAIYHKDCLDEYEKLKNRLQFLKIMRYGYCTPHTFANEEYDVNVESGIYKYDEIPNEYGCNCVICQRRPWFIFHTLDGDIKIGWRKRVINITFMPGFKEFPMNIFEDEYVTKVESKDGHNSIHAMGEQKAVEYLQRVFDYLHHVKE